MFRMSHALHKGFEPFIYYDARPKDPEETADFYLDLLDVFPFRPCQEILEVARVRQVTYSNAGTGLRRLHDIFGPYYVAIWGCEGLSSRESAKARSWLNSKLNRFAGQELAPLGMEGNDIG